MAVVGNSSYQGGHPAYPQKDRYAADDQPLKARPNTDPMKSDWHLRIGGKKVSPSFPTIKEAVKHYVDHYFDSPEKVHLYDGNSHISTYHPG